MANTYYNLSKLSKLQLPSGTTYRLQDNDLREMAYSTAYKSGVAYAKNKIVTSPTKTFFQNFIPLPASIPAIYFLISTFIRFYFRLFFFILFYSSRASRNTTIPAIIINTARIIAQKKGSQFLASPYLTFNILTN